MTGPGSDNRDSVTEAWGDPVWMESATTWLDDHLGAAGLQRTGDVTQPYVRPWATVLSAPTGTGRVWLKAMAPGTTFEVGLYELLVRLAPQNVLTPIASDPTRGWILLPDGGVSLGDRLTGTELVDHMLIALPQYARLQRSTMAHVESLLDMGLSDLRPEVLPARFDESIEMRGDDDSSPRLASIRPVFVDWCRRLSESPIEPGLDHNDLTRGTSWGSAPAPPRRHRRRQPSSTTGAIRLSLTRSEVRSDPFPGSGGCCAWTRTTVTFAG